MISERRRGSGNRSIHFDLIHCRNDCGGDYDPEEKEKDKGAGLSHV